VPNVQAKILKSQLTTEFTTRNCLKLTFSEFIAAAAAAVLDTKFAARQGAREKRDTHVHTPTTPSNRRAAGSSRNSTDFKKYDRSNKYSKCRCDAGDDE